VQDLEAGSQIISIGYIGAVNSVGAIRAVSIRPGTSLGRKVLSTRTVHDLSIQLFHLKVTP